MARPGPSLSGSVLEALEKRDSPNLIKTLFNREIGNLHPFKTCWGKLTATSYLLDRLILRQLLVSRNQQKPEVQRLRSKSTRKVSGETQMFWVEELRFVYNCKNQMYTCFTCHNGIERKKYQISSPQKWREWDTWYLPVSHPIGDAKKKMGILLFALSSSGKTVNIYFLDTGERYHQEIHLGNGGYKELIPCHETGKLIIPSTKSKLPSDVLFDCVLIDILHPTDQLRFQIKKDSFSSKPKPNDISCFNDMLILSYKNRVRILNLSSLLSNSNKSQLLDDAGSIPVTHFITDLDDVFEREVVVKKHGHDEDFRLGISMYPPIPFYIDNGSVRNLFTHQPLNVGFGENLKELHMEPALIQETDGNVMFLASLPARVVFHAKDEFCVAALREIDIGSENASFELVQEFYMKVETQLPSDQHDAGSSRTGRRRSSRDLTPVKYTFDDGTTSVRTSSTAAGHIDAVVVMEASCKFPHFKFHFFDSHSWTKLCTVVPSDIPKMTIASEDLPDYIFQVNETAVMIGCTRGGTNSSKIFVVSLLTEVTEPEDMMIDE